MEIDDTQTQQPISDDQDLAKALAGISDTDQNTGAVTDDGVETIPPVPLAPPPVDDATNDSATTGDSEETSQEDVPEEPVFTPSPTVDGGLDEVKKQAIDELRPLVGKLNISPEEKFDTYLLLLRSTDDRELIAPAHETATQIEDEARRAQALLDIIKEIDYLNNPQ